MNEECFSLQSASERPSVWATLVMADAPYTLPAGWVVMEAPDGTYYHHTETGRSSWAHPGRPLPPGWEAVTDGTGAIYYFCSATGESTWEWPESTRPAPANGTAASASASAPAAGSLGRSASWEEHLTDSGVPYYYNRDSGELTWARPAAEEPIAQGGDASVKKASMLREVMSLGAAMRVKGEEPFHRPLSEILTWRPHC